MKPHLIVACLVSATSLASADVSVIDNDKTIAVDCAKDKVVNLMGNHNAVTLTGVCTRVVLTGNHNTVTGSAVTVSLTGNHNTATLDGVDALGTPGNHNTATWKKTVDPKLKAPKISNPGTKNTVTKAS